MKEEIGVKAIECNLLQSKDPQCRSFKVKLTLKDRVKALSPEAWPEDIICRKYYSPRTPIQYD